jgi:hypothetical protein
MINMVTGKVAKRASEENNMVFNIHLRAFPESPLPFVSLATLPAGAA